MFLYLRKYHIIRSLRCHLVIRIAVDGEIGTRDKASCIYKIAHQLTASAGRRSKSRRCCCRKHQPDWKYLGEVVIYVRETWIYWGLRQR